MFAVRARDHVWARIPLSSSTRTPGIVPSPMVTFDIDLTTPPRPTHLPKERSGQVSFRPVTLNNDRPGPVVRLKFQIFARLEQKFRNCRRNTWGTFKMIRPTFAALLASILLLPAAAGAAQDQWYTSLDFHGAELT